MKYSEYSDCWRVVYSKISKDGSTIVLCVKHTLILHTHRSKLAPSTNEQVEMNGVQREWVICRMVLKSCVSTIGARICDLLRANQMLYQPSCLGISDVLSCDRGANSTNIQYRPSMDLWQVGDSPWQKYRGTEMYSWNNGLKNCISTNNKVLQFSQRWIFTWGPERDV